MLVHLDGENRVFLRAHIAKANPLWQNVANQADVLVIFQGENAYITPNWYTLKKQDPHGQDNSTLVAEFFKRLHFRFRTS